jgi:hypothetical protein
VFISSPNIKSRRLRLMGHVTHMGEIRNAYEILVMKPEGKRPLGRPRHAWEDNIKMYRKEIVCEDVDWILLSRVMVQWLVLMKSVIHLQIP